MRSSNDTLSYVLSTKTVCSLNSVNYLGITVDNQLSFKTHINNLESKIARFVGVFAKLSNYLPYNTLLILYIIIPLFIPISFISCLSGLPSTKRI